MGVISDQIRDALYKLSDEVRELKKSLLQLEAFYEKNSKEIQELQEIFKEPDKRWEKQFKETDKKIKELVNLFTTQWGKLVETLVEPGAVNFF